MSEFYQRICDVAKQNLLENIDTLSEHRLYRHLSPDKGGIEYLASIKEKYIRHALAKLRLGSHNFIVERGRWQCPKVEFMNRICDVCKEIEDEFHIIFVCERFENIRRRYLPLVLSERPSMYKFISFLNCRTSNNLRKFGVFCHKVLIEYNKLL